MSSLPGSATTAQRFPHLTRAENRQRSTRAEGEQFLIASREYVSCAGNGIGEYLSVPGLKPLDVYALGIGHRHSLRAKERVVPLDHFAGKSQLLAQVPPQFEQNPLSNDQLVLAQHQAHQIGTEASGTDRADEDVRVQRNSHDTSRNTSSSVR